jgi:hypothetical protein
MSTPFNIQDDKVVITKLNVSEITDPVSVSGLITVNDMVGKSLVVETLNVKNLIREGATEQNVGNWVVNEESQLNGKGFSWGWGEGNTALQYRTGGKLWTNGNIDIAPDKSYMIDGTEVLSKTALGAQITKSKLREVGNLTQLHVHGDTVLGDFAVFSSNFGRLGLNTENPNGTLSIVENDIEIVLGSQQIGKAYIGTYTNHDLVIGTDNQARITARHNGEIIIGEEHAKNSVVRIYGELFVEKLTTDTRTETVSPVVFNGTRATPLKGLGLVWAEGDARKHFVLEDSPDRIYSSESIDLASEKYFSIGGRPVLNETSLGTSIVQSNLNTVGTLQSLAVSGKTQLLDEVDAGNSLVKAKVLAFNDGTQQVSVDVRKIETSNQFRISVRNQDAIYVDPGEITLGNTSSPRRPVKVFGPLRVGSNNADPRVSLSVNGNAEFSGRMFSASASVPTTGIYKKGDIIWNDDPQPHSYIGWVCVVSGEPGQWLPFGNIASQ